MKGNDSFRFTPYPRHWSRDGDSARLLLIGESHYHNHVRPEPSCEWCREFRKSTFTKFVIEKDALEDEKAFFRKTREMFALPCARSNGFWRDVVFYNFIQAPLNRPRQLVGREIRRDYRNIACFVRLLTELKPRRVLVLGKENWNWLPSENDSSRIETSKSGLKLSGLMHYPTDQFAYWYRVDGGSWMLVGAVKHPSSFGFNARRWRKWVAKFMSFEVPG